MYAKAICPNGIQNKRNFIKCPECDEETLMTPSLSKMNEAIAKHFQLHKEGDLNLFKNHAKPINIRLAFLKQVLYII